MINLFDDQARKNIAQFIRDNEPRLEYNEEIFTIMEGNLKSLLIARMKEDLGFESTNSASTRTAPINIFRKIVDKQTKIYDNPVIRTVENGTEKDKEILEWYEETLKINRKFSKNNENYNAFLYALLQIGLSDPKPGSIYKTPFVRTIPNHQFLVMNVSRTDPTVPDVVIVSMGKRQKNASTEYIYYIYTNEQFVIINQGGEILPDLMSEKEMDGENVYGVTPFAYSNGSQDCPMPSIQTDNKDMAVLIPLLLTDLNYAVKFQAFSVFVGIDMDDTAIKLSPNSIMKLYTKPGAEHAASFDVVKPTVDISETLSLASSQMSLWLSSKGIRPGQIGEIGADKLASGISKMIDESDTYESIKKQIIIYQDFEAEFWNKLLTDIHPKWVAANVIEMQDLFSPNARVVTRFTRPVPMQSRGDLVRDLDTEVQAGLTSKKKAMAVLHSELKEDEIEELIKEIDEERVVIGGVDEQQTDQISP
jgi:hypothetical protein